jgi:hypothetical protein
MKSIGSIFAVLMLVVVVFGAMQIVGNEVAGNSNLDNESVFLIANISNNVDNNLNADSSFDEASSNLTVNATFDSQDVFAQEFLEGKSQGQQKQGIVKNLVKVPDLIILSLGVSQQDVAWIRSIVLLILTVLIGFAGYRVFFGGGKVTDN